MNILKGEHYKILPDGEVQIWGLETPNSYANGSLVLRATTLAVDDVQEDYMEITLPDWLADGIRELVKNKIEQENDRGA